MIANGVDHNIRWEPLVDVDCDFCPNTVTISEGDYQGRLHEGEIIKCSDCGGEQPREFAESAYSIKVNGDEPYMSFWDDASPEHVATDNAQEKE